MHGGALPIPSGPRASTVHTVLHGVLKLVEELVPAKDTVHERAPRTLPRMSCTST